MMNYYYRVDVGSLVFGAVGAVGKSFPARRVLAQVRFLARVRPQVNFQILQARKSLEAAVVLSSNNHPEMNK